MNKLKAIGLWALAGIFVLTGVLGGLGLIPVEGNDPGWFGRLLAGAMLVGLAWLISRKAKKFWDNPQPKSKNPQKSSAGSHFTIVEVEYADLSTLRPPGGGYGYAYIWDLDTPPQIGDWVYVTANDEIKSARVIEINVAPDDDYQLKEILMRVPQADFDNAQGKSLDLFARATAIIADPDSRTLKDSDIPPLAGTGTPEEANLHANAWWKIYKQAQRLELPDDQVQAFRKAGQAWYKIRDEGMKQ